MPITPRFSISQDSEFVIVRIIVPYVKVSRAELVVEGSPYLLKLGFNQWFEENEDNCRAVYDPSAEEGNITAYLPKLHKGEIFTELDVISKLLQKRIDDDNAICGIPKIELLDSSENDDLEAIDEINLKVDKTTSSTLDVGPTEDSASELLHHYSYGFDNRYCEVFTRSGDHFAGVMELADPEGTSSSERRRMRIAIENELFDKDRYLGDLFSADSDPYYIEAMSFNPIWSKLWDVWRAVATAATFDLANGIGSIHLGDKKTPTIASASPPTSPDALFQDPAIGGFAPDDDEEMRQEVIRKPFLPPSPRDTRNLLCCLADLIFGYCFEIRMTGDDPSVESAFNICRLSCVLSWSEDYRYHNSGSTILRDVVVNSLRRALIYPYLRSYKLGRKVLADVAKVLLCGRRAVLQCLLRLHRILRRTTSHYILNKIFITDYCLWVQSLDNDVFEAFGKEYNQVKGTVDKDDLNMNINDIEAKALSDMEEHGDAASSDTSSTSSDSSSDEYSDSDGSDSDNNEKIECGEFSSPDPCTVLHAKDPVSTATTNSAPKIVELSPLRGSISDSYTVEEGEGKGITDVEPSGAAVSILLLKPNDKSYCPEKNRVFTTSSELLKFEDTL